VKRSARLKGIDAMGDAWLKVAVRDALAEAESTASSSPHVEVDSNGFKKRSSLSTAERLTVAAGRSIVLQAEREALSKLSERRSVLDFAMLAVEIIQRILVAVSIQLLAASVRSQQPSRMVRMVSLSGLAVFFVFVESLTHRVVV